MITAKHLFSRVPIRAALFAFLVAGLAPGTGPVSAQEAGSPEGGSNNTSGSTSGSTAGTTAGTTGGTTGGTGENTVCMNMSMLENTAENIGLDIFQGTGLNSCMPDIRDRLLAAEGGGLGESCFDDMTTKNVDMGCGEIDDWMWYYWLNGMPIVDHPGQSFQDYFGQSPWQEGGVTVALNLNGDGTCSINAAQTEAGFCAPGTPGGDDTTDVVFVAEPISLIWDEVQAATEQGTFVLFPLDLRNPTRFYQWKASLNKPLLVYDPDHTGRITSATQLFGNWTFGGKKVASLGYDRLSDAMMSTPGQPWENGYEALGSLDSNGDRKVSGDELRNLALWFDENRDGVSQAGEVKTLKEAAVDTLFYSPDRTDRVSGDLHAALGYERLLDDGTRVRGASVDWMAKGYRSPEHVASLESIPTMGGYLPDVLQHSPNGVASYTGKTSITGIWEWTISSFASMDVKKPESYKGLLLIRSEDGKLMGGTVAEAPLKRRSRGATSVAKVFRLTGHTELDKKNDIVFKFETGVKNQPKTKTLNEARLIDATHLEGVSTMEIGKDKAGKPIVLSYTWKAEKLARKAKK